jgi:GAF domain-containing protein
MRIDPGELAESIGTLAGLDPEEGLAESLERVVAAATSLFGADTTGVMLLAKDGSLAAASAFDQQGELAEVAQQQLGQGPCMEAFTQGAPVTVVDIAADARFGQIALALRSAGIRGALSVPVEIEGGPVGTHSLSSAGSSPAASDGPPEVLAMSHGNEDQTT